MIFTFRRYPLLLAALLLCLATVSCGKNASEKLTIATGSKSGSFYKAGQSLARVMNATGRYDVSVLAGEGSVQNLKLIQEGKADLAIIQGDVFSSGNERSVTQLFREVLHILVRSDSGVESIDDFKGHKVCIGSSGSGMARTNGRVLAHFGIGPDSYTLCDTPFTESINMLSDGKVDAIMLVTGVFSPAVGKAVRSGDVRYVSIGDSGPGSETESLSIRYPYYKPFQIPKRLFGERPTKPVSTISVQTTLISKGDLPEDIAYELARLVYHNWGSISLESGVNVISNDNLNPGAFSLPLHEGAAGFFDRRHPGFLERYAEVIALCLTALTGLVSLLIAFVRIMRRRSKNLLDNFFSRVNDIYGTLSVDRGLDELRDLRRRVFQIRSDAFSKLIEEKLEADESFRILQDEIGQVLRELDRRIRSEGKDAK